MQVHMYIHVYTCIHADQCIYTHLNTQIHTHTYTHRPAYTNMLYTCTHTNTHALHYIMHTCICVYHACTCVHTSANTDTCTCDMRTHKHTYKYINSGCPIKFVYFMCAMKTKKQRVYVTWSWWTGTTKSGSRMKYSSFTHSSNQCCLSADFVIGNNVELTSRCKQPCNYLDANPGSFITNVWLKANYFTLL